MRQIAISILALFLAIPSYADEYDSFVGKWQEVLIEMDHPKDGIGEIKVSHKFGNIYEFRVVDGILEVWALFNNGSRLGEIIEPKLVNKQMVEPPPAPLLGAFLFKSEGNGFADPKTKPQYVPDKYAYRNGDVRFSSLLNGNLLTLNAIFGEYTIRFPSTNSEQEFFENHQAAATWRIVVQPNQFKKRSIWGKNPPAKTFAGKDPDSGTIVSKVDINKYIHQFDTSMRVYQSLNAQLIENWNHYHQHSVRHFLKLNTD